MRKTWKTNILEFNTSLKLDENELPKSIHVLNPFQGEFKQRINAIASEFYTKFYDDTNERELILGINPGRLGAGSTGIPFTDTKRLSQFCDIHIDEFSSHEPSSEFVYLLIEACGGSEKFYSNFFMATGFHGFHVFSGVIINFIILLGVMKGIYHKRGHYEMVEKTGLYWHFVDLVWVFVFTFFYLI